MRQRRGVWYTSDALNAGLNNAAGDSYTVRNGHRVCRPLHVIQRYRIGRRLPMRIDGLGIPAVPVEPQSTLNEYAWELEGIEHRVLD